MNELLRRARVIIADGAMGTQLQAAGLAPGACGELWNLQHPERVLAVQRTYVDAGAEVLLTNTFGGSRIALERHGLGDRVAEINTAAALLAGRAAEERAWVMGDIGPFGGFLEPVGDTSWSVAYDSFAEQAAALLAGFVDGIVIETMSALEEVEVAVAAARDAGAKLIAASLTFDATRVGIRTMTGATPQHVAEGLSDLAVDILGINCGTGLKPADYVEIVQAYRTVNTRQPVLVKMNAGAPRLVGDQTVYDATPAEFATAARRLIDEGADIIGGCCGTGPAHITALREAVNHLSLSV